MHKSFFLFGTHVSALKRGDCIRRVNTRSLTIMARQHSTPASYYRGGTSRGVMIQPKHLPPNRADWNKIFLQIMGSPDPHGRQLDGMGAGISSLSKICLVSPSKHPDADVDYTFVGIGIERDEVDMAGNCGNMSSAVGPYAWNQRLLGLSETEYEKDAEVTVRIMNTNTNVVIRSMFFVVGGEASVQGDFAIDGVSGTGSRIQLDFLRPGGAKTGKLLPTGNVVDSIEGFEVSCVDAANPAVFLRAEDFGVDPTILPDEFNKHPEKLELLDKIRTLGAVKMGMIEPGQTAPRTVPKVALVATRRDQRLLSKKVMSSADIDVVCRFLSDTQPHRAIPLTGALCTAAAAKLKGSIVNSCLPQKAVDEDMISIGHPSGRIQVNAKVDGKGGIESATVFRTARRIMEGEVFWNA